MAPKIFGDVELGKTFAIEPSYIIGRKIVTNTMNLVRESNKYYMKLIFSINSIDGTKAFTEFSGSELLREYITRMVLRRVRQIALVQDLTTKDGVKIRVKSIALTSKKMSTRTKFDLASMIKESVKQQVE
jgi:small subunit ribosomal protein S3Ae